jgi:hypothetical protein
LNGKAGSATSPASDRMSASDSTDDAFPHRDKGQVAIRAHFFSVNFDVDGRPGIAGLMRRSAEAEKRHEIPLSCPQKPH